MENTSSSQNNDQSYRDIYENESPEQNNMFENIIQQGFSDFVSSRQYKLIEKIEQQDFQGFKDKFCEMSEKIMLLTKNEAIEQILGGFLTLLSANFFTIGNAIITIQCSNKVFDLLNNTLESIQNKQKYGEISSYGKHYFKLRNKQQESIYNLEKYYVDLNTLIEEYIEEVKEKIDNNNGQITQGDQKILQKNKKPIEIQIQMIVNHTNYIIDGFGDLESLSKLLQNQINGQIKKLQDQKKYLNVLTTLNFIISIFGGCLCRVHACGVFLLGGGGIGMAASLSFYYYTDEKEKQFKNLKSKFNQKHVNVMQYKKNIEEDQVKLIAIFKKIKNFQISPENLENFIYSLKESSQQVMQVVNDVKKEF